MQTWQKIIGPDTDHIKIGTFPIRMARSFNDRIHTIIENKHGELICDCPAKLNDSECWALMKLKAYRKLRKTLYPKDTYQPEVWNHGPISRLAEKNNK